MTELAISNFHMAVRLMLAQGVRPVLSDHVVHRMNAREIEPSMIGDVLTNGRATTTPIEKEGGLVARLSLKFRYKGPRFGHVVVALNPNGTLVLVTAWCSGNCFGGLESPI